MKRFTLILAAVAALAVFSTSSADASDSYYGRRSYGHGYATPSYGHGYARYGNAVPSYGGYGVSRSYGRSYGHGRSYGYNRSYGHGGGVQISTPRFGLRIGH